MTIEEIEKTLPNGFHDASLEKLNIHYDTREAELEMLVDVGNPDAPSEEAREGTRKGVLTLTSFLFCVIEPPDSRSSYQEVRGLWIADSGPAISTKLATKLPGPLPKGAFAHYFFINDWNSFIFIAAEDARFEWKKKR